MVSKLHTAFVKGKVVKGYTFTALHEKKAQKASKAAWSDFHASALAILLAGIPQQTNNKHRMDSLIAIADELTELHFKG